MYMYYLLRVKKNNLLKKYDQLEENYLDILFFFYYVCFRLIRS